MSCKCFLGRWVTASKPGWTLGGGGLAGLVPWKLTADEAVICAVRYVLP